MLAPRIERPEMLDVLQTRWRADGRLRVEDALVEARSARFIEALRTRSHSPDYRFHPTEGHQLWRFSWAPGEDCEHPLCELGRWLRGPGLRWVTEITGLALAPAPDPHLISDRTAKASFFEAYDESGEGRAVAFQLHLTPAPWPVEWGGHLELLDGPDGDVIARFAPTWNALDLFDVRCPGAWRRLPLVQKHLEGFVVSGWYHLGQQDPAPERAGREVAQPPGCEDAV